MADQAILRGPTKFEIMQALFVRKPSRTTILFLLEGRKALTQVLVDGVTSSDNSGESWTITGYEHGTHQFTATYRTDTQTGIYRMCDTHN
jgi:hypothetical protein